MKKKQRRVQLALVFIGLLLFFLTYFFYPNINKDKLSEDQPIDKNFAEISFSLDRQVDYFPLATTLEITGLNEYKYAILVNGVERSFVNGSGFNTITIGLDSLDKYYIRIVDASLINPHEGAVPENFKLYNNFPNPFIGFSSNVFPKACTD